MRNLQKRMATLLIIEQNIPPWGISRGAFRADGPGSPKGESRFDGQGALTRITQHLSTWV